MEKPNLILNGEVYIMPEPKVKLWRLMAVFRDKSNKLKNELSEQLEKLNILKNNKDPQTIEAFANLLDKIEKLTEKINNETVERKLRIIKAAFEIDDIDDLGVDAVPALFVKIDTYLNVLMSGKADQLPNPQAPIVEE